MEKPARVHSNLKRCSRKKSAPPYRAPLPTHTNPHMTNEGTRWKADRQVGHPVILAWSAQMIGCAFYSATASTDAFLLRINYGLRTVS